MDHLGRILVLLLEALTEPTDADDEVERVLAVDLLQLTPVQIRTVEGVDGASQVGEVQPLLGEEVGEGLAEGTDRDLADTSGEKLGQRHTSDLLEAPVAGDDLDIIGSVGQHLTDRDDGDVIRDGAGGGLRKGVVVAAVSCGCRFSVHLSVSCFLREEYRNLNSVGVRRVTGCPSRSQVAAMIKCSDKKVNQKTEHLLGFC